jgi:hypothetical protein
MQNACFECLSRLCETRLGYSVDGLSILLQSWAAPHKILGSRSRLMASNVSRVRALSIRRHVNCTASFSVNRTPPIAFCSHLCYSPILQHQQPEAPTDSSHNPSLTQMVGAHRGIDTCQFACQLPDRLWHDRGDKAAATVSRCTSASSQIQAFSCAHSSLSDELCCTLRCAKEVH